MTKSKNEILWMGGGFQILNSSGYLKENLLKQLSKLNLRIIQPMPNNEFKKYFKKNNMEFIPKKYKSQTSFFVFGDTVIIGSLVNEDIFGIKIDNPDIAKTFHNYFELIWQSY